MTTAAFDVSSGGSVLRIRGDLDMATAPVLERALLSAAEAPGLVVLDVRDMGFMDSAGIKLLITVAKRLPEDRLIIHGTHDQVAAVLEMVGLEKGENIHTLRCTVATVS